MNGTAIYNDNGNHDIVNKDYDNDALQLEMNDGS